MTTELKRKLSSPFIRSQILLGFAFEFLDEVVDKPESEIKMEKACHNFEPP